MIFSWIFWSIAILTGKGWLEFPTIIFSIIGLLGPFIVAVTMVKRGFLDCNLKEYFSNCFNPKVLPINWYLYIICFVLILVLVPVLISLFSFGLSLSDLAGLGASAPFLLIGFIAGGLEEAGWRGFGQRVMQKRFNILVSGFIIGIFWALWHLPLFFLEGTYQYSLSFNSYQFWLFNLAIILGSPFYGWIFNAAGGVAFAAFFYHSLANVTRELFSFEITNIKIELINVTVEAALTIGVIILAKKTMFSKKG